MNIAAILFDVDGTLLDTGEYILASYRHATKLYKFPPITREMVIAAGGRPLEEVYAQYCPGGDISALCLAHRTFQQHHPEIAKPFPGVNATLQTLTNAGIKTAAISTRHLTVRSTLEQAGLTPYLHVIISGEEVKRSKPDPEGIFRCLNDLGVAPAAALMVGDMRVDIEAGKNAGVGTVAATYGLYRSDQFLGCQPDYRINRISELPDLVYRLTERGSS
ncbi:HAD-IA family hydrolase [Patescibacteria group bacterium]|nr:HAD-IA family hydrolase [Patescibacteria group bacterium]